MMKRILTIVMVLILLTSLYRADYASVQEEGMRGLWVATVGNIDYPKTATTDPVTLKREAIAILDDAQRLGMNTVFLQVRPTADALYSSELFPWSAYLTGDQGVAPADGFDPLAFWTEEAHARGMELHAWINPYRVTRSTTGNLNDALDSLSKDHIVRQHPEYVVAHGNNLYFDPAKEAVRALIADGVAEIIENYDIDGIHFDDYFYPGRDFNDDRSYALLNRGNLSRDDWRRDNVNRMIEQVYDRIKDLDPEVSFGLSPFGIWANEQDVPGGSATRGNSSYSAHYADTLAWIEGGYVDYIAPQIYWHNGFEIADYGVLQSWWREQVRGSDVALYIGQAAYRTVGASSSDPWYGASELLRQLRMNEASGEVDGSIFFSYRSFLNNPRVFEAVADHYGGTEPAPTQPLAAASTGTSLILSLPSYDLRTESDGYYLAGSSDPSKPLVMNGRIIADRTASGYFGIYVPLDAGANSFTFTQGTRSVTRTITKGGSSWTPTPVSAPVLVATSMDPAEGIVMYEAGQEMTLSVMAPIGAKVRAIVGDDSLVMTPGTTFDYGGPIYNTTYKATYTFPKATSTTGLRSLGSPVFEMTFKGKTSSLRSTAQLFVLGESAGYYGEMRSDRVDSYFNATRSGGSAEIMTRGMTDRVDALYADMVRFSDGRWVKLSDVALTQKTGGLTFDLKRMATDRSTLRFDFTHLPRATATYASGVLTLAFPETTRLSGVPIPTSPLVSEIQVDGNRMKLSLVPSARIDGYHFTSEGETLVLHLHQRPVVQSGPLPLSGIKIMIDPGHGGSDGGARGLSGDVLTEKDINLGVSTKLQKRLEDLGATVIMTRQVDQALSLSERLQQQLEKQPDLMLSVHANSIGAERDITQIQGFSTHLKHPLARGIGDLLQREAIAIGRKDRRVNENNFYVVRSTAFPAVLVEMGFVPNAGEYEYLMSDFGREELAAALSRGIVKYFE